MARRKVFVAGRSSEAWLAEALGYWSRQTMRYILSETEKPIFDLSKVEARTGISIQEEIAEEIQVVYESYAVDIYSSAMSQLQKSSDDIAAQQIEGIDQSEFRNFVDKLQRKAAELEDIVDSLADFDCGLLIRPEDNRDRIYYKINLQSIIDAKLASDSRSFTVNMQGFSDYFSFRRLLDYFKRFELINKPFNNKYALRYSFETGHTDYERFIRHIVVILIRSGYPATRRCCRTHA